VASAKYSIRDIEHLTGIKAHTLRIWEKRYGIVTPKRTPTNIRYYTDDDLKKLLNISILNRNGYKISSIVNLDSEDLSKKIISLSKQSVDGDNSIENLIISMIEIDEAKFEKILSNLIINMGFEETFLKIIIPFFEKIGILWQVGAINPGQEHFITNLIRQKIIVAIDSLFRPANLINQKTFLLYLPDGELHEIGLLFYSYLIQKRGHKVIYLGQMVPFNDVLEVTEKQNPDAFLMLFTTNLQSINIEEHLNELHQRYPAKHILTEGFQFKINTIKVPPKTIVLEDLNKFKEELHLIEKD